MIGFRFIYLHKVYVGWEKKISKKEKKRKPEILNSAHHCLIVKPETLFFVKNQLDLHAKLAKSESQQYPFVNIITIIENH